jgi:lipopolysaccharide transport protein LptA
MQRIRLLRIVLPVILLAFVVALAVTFRTHPSRGGVPVEVSPDQAARMEGFRFSDLVGGRRRMLVEANVGRVDDQGAFDVDHVSKLEVDRENQGPLVLTADHGAGSGGQGKRIVRLDGGVTLKDDTGITLEIPSVEIDQVTGVVRSLGSVKMRNEAWNGTASAIVYSLSGGPTEMFTLEFAGPDAGRLVAQHATVPAGSRTITLTGDVEAGQSGMTIRADSIALTRREGGKLESLTATPTVTGTAATLGGGPAGLMAHEVHAAWDASGAVSSVTLIGDARLTQTRGTLAAQRIDAKAVSPGGPFKVDASDQVAVSGPNPKGGLASLTCDALRAIVEPKGSVHDGVATGHVRFDSTDAAGEAADATFTSLDPDGTVTLRAGPDRRARLGLARTRVVADTIVTDLRGVKLRADGRVESTLLPATSPQPATASSMFSATEAVHFVSASLDSANSGARLLFQGDVRGWQGERTLSADEVEMIQEGQILNAKGHVSTRMPREATRAASEADYVQVGADKLNYRGAAHVAEYDGSVRVRQAEGWLESPHLIVTMNESGPGLKEVQAVRGVHFEYRSPGEKGVPTTATGEGDRAVYDPADHVLRVYGDKAPATVRSTGPNGGTTVGRVLRYDVDTGALEVESGERDRATIRTPKK